MPAGFFMRLLLFLFFPLYLLSHSFTIASYNVYNLFDDAIDGTEYHDFKPPKWNTTKYLKKLNDIAFAIQRIDADIIALQEVENENTLHRLKTLLPKYQYYAIDTKKGSAISVALLSKYPIKKSQKIAVNSSRDILKSVVLINGNPLAIYVNHWQSLNSPEKSRIAYATALMNAVAKSPYKEYIFIGDLNSNYDRYLDNEAPVAINHTLNTVNNMALVTKENLTNNQHYNLWLDVAHGQRYSYLYKGRNNTLDHIIVPYTLFDAKGIDYVDGSFKVIKEAPFYAKGKINNRYSDHLPIIATFSTKPFQQTLQPHYKTITIEDIYQNDGIKKPQIIQNATVIYKDKYGAIIKDATRPIYIYTPNITVEIGKSYDLIVKETKHYHGVVQIGKIRILNQKSGSLRGKFLKIEGVMLNDSHLNEVVEAVEGEYSNGKFIYDGGKTNIYFQDKSKKPSHTTKLRLQNVRIGKYQGSMQIIVSHASKVVQ